MWQAYFADPEGVLTMLGCDDTATLAYGLCMEHLTTLIMASNNIIEATKVDETTNARTKVIEHITEPDGWIFCGASQSVVRGYLGVVETDMPRARPSYAQMVASTPRPPPTPPVFTSTPQPSHFPRELIDELKLKLQEHQDSSYDALSS
jgi:hypothetical protein